MIRLDKLYHKRVIANGDDGVDGDDNDDATGSTEEEETNASTA